MTALLFLQSGEPIMNPFHIPHPAIYTDLYQLTMGQGYFKSGMHQKEAHFDYFFRDAPFDGSYVVFAGLADLLSVLASLRFTGDERLWLKQQGFHSDFCEFLKEYRFDASITSVREGEIVFPDEPVFTVSGPLFSCQLVETMLLNILNFQSLIATKACRLRQACGDRKIVDFGLRRAQGTGAISASRAAYIGGVDATSNVLTGFQHQIPVSGTMAHSWIQSFETELEAFRTYAEVYPDSTILLVDTYDTLRSGIPNAITVGKELEKKGHLLAGIRLDSGNLEELAKEARRMLDEAGLSRVLIAVSDQLDEHVIQSLLQNNAPIDLFGVGTRLLTGHPDGSLSGVYKICALDGRTTMKLTNDILKSNLPGVKELYRESDKDEKFRRDHIILASGGNETDDSGSDLQSIQNNPNTENIRSSVMDRGRLLGHPTVVREIAEFSRYRQSAVPDDIKRLTKPDRFEIQHGRSLKKLIRNLKKSHYERIDRS